MTVVILFGFSIGALAPWILGIIARFKFYNKDVERLLASENN